MRAVHKGKIARRPEPNINIQYLYIKCELSVLLSFCHSRRNPDIVLVVLALSLFERAQDVRMYGVVPWWNGAWSGMLERERDLSRTRRVRCEVAMARSASQPSKPVATSCSHRTAAFPPPPPPHHQKWRSGVVVVFAEWSTAGLPRWYYTSPAQRCGLVVIKVNDLKVVCP